HIGVARVHGAKLVNGELSILHTGPDLRMKKRAGRLQALRDPDDEREHGKKKQHYRPGNGQIDGALAKAIERVLQRFFAQTDEAEAVIFEMGHRVTQFFFEITDDKQAHPELIADPNNVPVNFSEERKLQEDHLGDAALANDVFQIVGRAQHRDA